MRSAIRWLVICLTVMAAPMAAWAQYGGALHNGGWANGMDVPQPPRSTTPAIEDLSISAFTFIQVGRTSAEVGFNTNRNTKCRIWTRTEGPPLGSWLSKGYLTSFHASPHDHMTLTLVNNTWYHLYVQVFDDTAEPWPTGYSYYPFNDPANHGYRRFKTGDVPEVDPNPYY